MEEIIKKVRKKFNKDLVAIVLFGSRARNEARENSDYDINIFTKSKKDFSMPYPYNISVYSLKDFEMLKKLGHPFIYCCFRDGKVIYGNKEWFIKEKENIMKLKPSKEIIKRYLQRSISLLEFMISTNYINIEDGKIAANQAGFALVMKNNIYPRSPHSLYHELKKNGYSSIAEIIRYLQRKYYYNEGFKEKIYLKKVKHLRDFLVKIEI